MHDLFGVEVPFTAELPDDTEVAGFDNNGDALSLSPVLLESYLKLARKATNLILGTTVTSPVTEQFVATGRQSDWLEDLPMGTRGGLRATYYFPRTGEYELRAYLDNVVDTGGQYQRYLYEPHEGANFFRVRTKVSAGQHSVVVTFPDAPTVREGSVPNLDGGPGGFGMGGPIDIGGNAIHTRIQFWVDAKKLANLSVGGSDFTDADNDAQPGPRTLFLAEISGPFNAAASQDSPARRRLLTCAPRHASEEMACAKSILGSFARRAYRREITQADLDPILAIYARKRHTGSFDESVGIGICRILISPDFLFRVEQEASDSDPPASLRVSDAELAARLSFFIWSSGPDDELLDKARDGELRDPAGLSREMRRMLQDHRADALIDSFALQWLGLRHAASLLPNRTAYPDFSIGDSLLFAKETRMFLRSLLVENRSILDVISSDYTFLNERLAYLYGVDGITGSAFRRVHLPDASTRGGILGQGSVLLVTSHPAQTSPILRGKWVLTNMLNSPPPTPPPGVPPLNVAPAADGHQLTTREQIERHRSSPVCVSCHAKMDPYGIALENFDVIGRWRTEENGNPLDTSASLPRGEPFVGPSGLKKLLLARSDEFATATVTRLMTYALGRRLTPNDKAAVSAIVDGARPSGYRFADLVGAVVTSQPFQTRNTRSPRPSVAKEQP